MAFSEARIICSGVWSRANQPSKEESVMSMRSESPRSPWSSKGVLLLPFVALMFVPIYNRLTPAVFGVPFFYWYQLLWVALSALAVGIVYLVDQSRRAR